jgi:hypothetical protein
MQKDYKTNKLCSSATMPSVNNTRNKLLCSSTLETLKSHKPSQLKKIIKRKIHRKVHTTYVEKKTKEVLQQVHTTYVGKKTKEVQNTNPPLWPSIEKCIFICREISGGVMEISCWPIPIQLMTIKCGVKKLNVVAMDLPPKSKLEQCALGS